MASSGMLRLVVLTRTTRHKIPEDSILHVCYLWQPAGNGFAVRNDLARFNLKNGNEEQQLSVS
jgi:hypothetical protein